LKIRNRIKPILLSGQRCVRYKMLGSQIAILGSHLPQLPTVVAMGRMVGAGSRDMAGTILQVSEKMK
jgi:hypothetical protein